ncbi:MAG: BON domain-containing protein [Candidatus Acidiferrum sp.]
MGKILRTVSIGIGALTLSFAAATVHGRTIQQEPDNTSANKNQSTTADQQKNDPADRELAQKIRQSITNDKSLSTDAHNVKVIVRNGKVTLKGPVQSEDEKKSIVDKATDLAGADNVTNKLTVKS